MSRADRYSNNTNASDVVSVRDWKSLYNVLTHLAPFSLTVDRYVTPIWCAIGVLGNLVSVVNYLIACHVLYMLEDRKAGCLTDRQGF